MCDITACILKGAREENVLEAVERAEAHDQNVTLTNIFGEKITIKAIFKSYNADTNKILFEPL